MSKLSVFSLVIALLANFPLADLAGDTAFDPHFAFAGALQDRNHQAQPSHLRSVPTSLLIAAICLGTFSFEKGFRYSTCRLTGPV